MDNDWNQFHITRNSGTTDWQKFYAGIRYPNYTTSVSQETPEQIAIRELREEVEDLKGEIEMIRSGGFGCDCCNA